MSWISEITTLQQENDEKVNKTNRPYGLYLWMLGLLSGLWIVIGIYTFFFAGVTDWALGELGDYFGGGLGGLAILGVVYTALLQSKQLELQRLDMEEAGVLRSFETFKPELEGLSMRIISKIVTADISTLNISDFEEMSSKFRDDNDRTVFLRALKKIDLTPDEISLDPEAGEALRRFRAMIEILQTSLSHIEDARGKNDFCEALQSTEVFQCYYWLFGKPA